VLQQYVDVSPENNGWLPAPTPQGPLAAGVTSFVLHLPAGRYYVRINQMLPNGTLEASETNPFSRWFATPIPGSRRRQRRCFSAAFRRHRRDARLRYCAGRGSV
jgi:hypothetical protein